MKPAGLTTSKDKKNVLYGDKHIYLICYTLATENKIICIIGLN
jgi:hypothetical protein